MEALVFREFDSVDLYKPACKELEVLAYRCHRAETDSKQVRFNRQTNFAPAEPKYQYNQNRNPTNFRRSHSPADVRNDHRWEDQRNNGPQRDNWCTRSPSNFNRPNVYYLHNCDK